MVSIASRKQQRKTRVRPSAAIPSFYTQDAIARYPPSYPSKDGAPPGYIREVAHHTSLSTRERASTPAPSRIEPSRLCSTQDQDVSYPPNSGASSGYTRHGDYYVRVSRYETAPTPVISRPEAYRYGSEPHGQHTTHAPYTRRSIDAAIPPEYVERDNFYAHSFGYEAPPTVADSRSKRYPYGSERYRQESTHASRSPADDGAPSGYVRRGNFYVPIANPEPSRSALPRDTSGPYGEPQRRDPRDARAPQDPRYPHELQDPVNLRGPDSRDFRYSKDTSVQYGEPQKRDARDARNARYPRYPHELLDPVTSGGADSRDIRYSKDTSVQHGEPRRRDARDAREFRYPVPSQCTHVSVARKLERVTVPPQPRFASQRCCSLYLS